MVERKESKGMKPSVSTLPAIGGAISIGVAIALIVVLNDLITGIWDNDEEDQFSLARVSIQSASLGINADLDSTEATSLTIQMQILSVLPRINFGFTKTQAFDALNLSLFGPLCSRVCVANSPVMASSLGIAEWSGNDSGQFVCYGDPQQNGIPITYVIYPTAGPGKALFCSLIKVGDYGVRMGPCSASVDMPLSDPNTRTTIFSQVPYKALDGRKLYLIQHRRYFAIPGLFHFYVEGLGSTLSWQPHMQKALPEGGILFLMDLNGKVVTTTYNPDQQRIARCNDTAESCLLVNAANSSFPLLRDLYTNVLRAAAINASATFEFKATLDGKKYHAVIKPVVNRAGLTLHLVCILPVEGKQKEAAFIVCCVLICFSAVVTMVVTGIAVHVWFLRPIDVIVKQMREVTELNFECLKGDEESDESAQKHVFTEMAELQRGFNDMASSIRLFSKYIPKEVVKELMMMGVTSSANSMVSKVLTVTFVDISGFSMMCESLQTEDLVSLAEQYFETVTQTLTAHGCTIDKYIGDTVMGFWGAPLDFVTQGYSACCAALHVMTAIAKVQEAFLEYGMTLTIRIGVHRGAAVVGNIGCVERLSYTALGDTVNVASRLQGLNKHFRTSVIVSEPVYHDSFNEGEAVFCARRLGLVKVKGRPHRHPRLPPRRRPQARDTEAQTESGDGTSEGRVPPPTIAAPTSPRSHPTLKTKCPIHCREAGATQKTHHQRGRAVSAAVEESTQNSTISSKSAQLDLDQELDSISALMLRRRLARGRDAEDQQSGRGLRKDAV